MDSSIGQDNVAAPATMSTNSLSTTTRDDQLALDLRQLSLDTASASNLPASPKAGASLQRKSSLAALRNYPPSPMGGNSRPPHIQRSPSSMSLNARSTTPTLHKRSSMNSLNGVGGMTPPRQSPSRRASTQLSNAPGAMAKSPLSGLDDLPPPLPPITAASVASSYFQSELDILHSDKETGSGPTETIVILHDSCYGHRYSRPRTSRAALSTIVERPERIHASIVGLSMAYVRLGERHAGGVNAPHPKKDVTDLLSIPFRIRTTTRKIDLASPTVTNVHGAKWMEELKIMCNTAEAKLAANGKELTRPDMPRNPDQGVPHKFHEGDLYLCSESLNAMEGALGAVCEGVDAVFNGAANGTGPRRAFVAIRPPGHHCAAEFPSGFCWLNNVHVGISHAALTHGLTHAAMIDFDLHHGDGSQAITWEHNMRATTLPKNAAAWKKTSIGYFSLHDINSYPCEMGDPEKVKNASLCIENAHGQSIWNVHLQPWKSEQEFWELYETKYLVLLEKTRNFLRTQTQRIKAIPNGPKPKACIFFSAGFDASEWESAGMQRHKVNVPTEFYARIARDVVKLAAEEGCAVDGRIISVLEGGYSDRALSSGVLSHISGLAGSDPAPVKREDIRSGLGYEMSRKSGFANGDVQLDEKVEAHEYDPSWWALHNLEALDAVMHPPPPPEIKKPRDAPNPTYSSPTQSYSAKMVTTPHLLRRSSSNLSNGALKAVARPLSPPPPEVEWTVAAHELSKLLIPTTRQTMSCKVEDLSAEATRARKERQSILAPPAGSTNSNEPTLPPPRMSLRERKPAGKASNVSAPEAADKVSRSDRRKTVAGGAVIAAEKALARGSTPNSDPSYAQSTTSSRRLSLASNSGSTVSGLPGSRAPSVGPHDVPRRPGSSASTRPESSMSSQAHSIPPAPMVVKKTRAPSAKPRAPRKIPAEASERVGATKAAATAARSTSQGAASSSADLDSLTSGMKKVSITLTTQAQRDAREKAAKENAKPTMPKTTKASPKKASTLKRTDSAKATTSKAISPKPSTSTATSAAPQTPSVSAFTAPAAETIAAPDTPQAPKNLQTYVPTPSGVPLPASLPATPQHVTNSLPPSAPSPPPTSATSATSASGNSNLFIPYQPEGPTPKEEIKIEGQGLTWLEPNTATPAKFKDVPAADNSKDAASVAGPAAAGAEKVKLPVFTSTGNIPFAIKKEEDVFDERIWEVPDTPRSK